VASLLQAWMQWCLAPAPRLTTLLDEPQTLSLRTHSQYAPAVRRGQAALPAKLLEVSDLSSPSMSPDRLGLHVEVLHVAAGAIAQTAGVEAGIGEGVLVTTVLVRPVVGEEAAHPRFGVRR
jgi:hypothetical protein